MRFRVNVSMTCSYLIDASTPEDAERLAASSTPREAENIEIVEVTVVPEEQD